MGDRRTDAERVELWVDTWGWRWGSTPWGGAGRRKRGEEAALIQ